MLNFSSFEPKHVISQEQHISRSQFYIFFYTALFRINHLSKTNESHPQFSYFPSCSNRISRIKHIHFSIFSRWFMSNKLIQSSFPGLLQQHTGERAPLHHKCDLFETKGGKKRVKRKIWALPLWAGNSTQLTPYANRETTEQRRAHPDHALEGWQAATTDLRCLFALNRQTWQIS